MSTRFSRLQILSAFVVLMFLALATPLWAQKDAGAIVGLVRDASGAVVTGAKVTVTDVDRGIELTLSTNDAGEYVASPLRIGRYSVSVEKEGFKKAVAGPIQVNIQDRVNVDLKLEPGMATEIVMVTGQRPQLETETSELGEVVDSKRINALPLNGRNYAQLALLGVGIAAAEPGSRVETTYGFSANGARSLQNNFLLDGIDNNANLGDVLNGSAYVVQPAVDAIAEFKVETNAYSAEFGRGNGAIMNAVIKSGTNQIHGDVWEFLRNEKFDATNAFDQFGQQPYKQNQFGVTLGGPIVKNKMFLFGDYEGLRIRQGLPQLSAVPTQSEIGGDFSAFLDTNKPAYGRRHEWESYHSGRARLQRQPNLSGRNLQFTDGRIQPKQSQRVLRRPHRRLFLGCNASQQIQWHQRHHRSARRGTRRAVSRFQHHRGGRQQFSQRSQEN
jgi:hypothetical protein